MWWNDLVADFTLGLVVVGLLQLGLFYWQLRLIRESLNDAKAAADAAKESADVAKVQANTAQATLKVLQDTAERELRAYVHVAAVNVSAVGTLINYFIEIKNFGQTPAYDVRLRYGVAFRDIPLNLALKLPDELQGAVAILPPQVSMHDDFTPPQELGQNQLAKIAGNTAAIFVFGQVTYRDVFSKERLTEFRYLLGKEAAQQTTGALTICPEGNKAD